MSIEVLCDRTPWVLIKIVSGGTDYYLKVKDNDSTILEVQPHSSTVPTDNRYYWKISETASDEFTIENQDAVKLIKCTNEVTAKCTGATTATNDHVKWKRNSSNKIHSVKFPNSKFDVENGNFKITTGSQDGLPVYLVYNDDHNSRMIRWCKVGLVVLPIIASCITWAICHKIQKKKSSKN